MNRSWVLLCICPENLTTTEDIFTVVEEFWQENGLAARKTPEMPKGEPCAFPEGKRHCGGRTCDDFLLFPSCL